MVNQEPCSDWLRQRCSFLTGYPTSHSAQTSGSGADRVSWQATRPIALARVLLALGNILVVYLDPSLPRGRSLPMLVSTYGIVGLMLVYALWVWHSRSTHRAPQDPSRVVTALDVLFTATLVVSTGGNSSPFYMWNVFTVVGCSLEHGWRLALRVAVVQISLYMAICLPHAGQADFVIGVFLVRTSFLFVIALVLAYMGQQLLEQNRMLAGLHTAASHMGAGRTTEALLGRIADSLTDLLEVEQGLVSVWREGGRPVAPALVNMDREQADRLLRLVSEHLTDAPSASADLCPLTGEPHRCLGADAASLAGVRNLLVARLPGGRGWTGLLIACNRLGQRGFTAADQELAELLSVQAGALLETARLQEQRRYHAGMDERRRIAAELHDRLIQTLASIDIRAMTCGDLCVGRQWEPLSRELRTLKQLAEEALEEARGAISELAPVRLREEGLAVYLEDCLSRFRERAAVPVESTIRLQSAGLPEPTALLLIGLLREGLNNVRKHAGASHTTVTIRQLGNEILFRLTDDGAGFEPDTLLLQRSVNRQYGLAYLRQRTAAMGGELTVTSRPGDGTVLEARVPILSEEALMDLLVTAR